MLPTKRLFFFIFLFSLLCGFSTHCVASGRAAYIRFKTKGTNQQPGFQSLRDLGEQVRKHLVADGRLIDAYDLPENQAKRAMFHIKTTGAWPLYGVKDLEFDGVTVNGEFVSHDLWVSIACQASELSSKKIADLKALISTAFGENAMKNVEIAVEIEPWLNLRP